MDDIGYGTSRQRRWAIKKSCSDVAERGFRICGNLVCGCLRYSASRELKNRGMLELCAEKFVATGLAALVALVLWARSLGATNIT